MPKHITRLHIDPENYPTTCQPLIDELFKAYDENERLVRVLRASVIETEVATGISLDAKSRYELLATVLEADYRALAQHLREEADAFVVEVDQRLSGMNNIRRELDYAGAPVGITEAERIARLHQTIKQLQRQVDYDKELIALYEERAGKVTRDPTPKPGTLTAVSPDADERKREDSPDQ